MRAKTFLALFGVAVFLVGCEPIFSLHPLYTDKDVVFEEQLLGTWGNEAMTFTVERWENHTYLVYHYGVEEGELTIHEGRLVQLGPELFLDLKPSEPMLATTLEGEAFPLLFPAHTFYRVRFREDVLEVAYLNDEWVNYMMESGHMTMAHERIEDFLFLTASTEDLQSIARGYGNNPVAFLPVGLFRRQPPELGQVKLAQARAKRRFYRSAVAAYWKALEHRPDYTEAYKGMGHIYLYDLQLLEPAIASYQRAVELAPDDTDAWHELGVAHSRKGNIEEALGAMQKCKAMEPDNAQYWGDVAFVLLKKGNTEESRIHFEKAIQLDPKSTEARYRLAFVYFVEGRFHEAVQAFENYLRWDQTPNVYALLWHYQSLRHLGREEEARELLERYAERFHPSSYSFQLIQYHRGNLTAEELLLRPRTPFEVDEAYYYIGYSYLLDGDPAAARPYLEKAANPYLFSLLETWAARARLKDLDGE